METAGSVFNSSKSIIRSSPLADCLPILAAFGEQSDVSVGALAPQTFVNRIVEDLPGLRKDHQLIASLKKQLPMLMEAAPDPLLTALEHLLESGQIAPLFQDSKGDFPMLGGDSPHTYIYGHLN